MTYIPTPEEVAAYFRDAVARFAEHNIPGQVIFDIKCNCNPHSNSGLDIQFGLFRVEQVNGSSFEAVIDEHVRRYAIKQQLAPLMIERHPHNDPVPVVAPDVANEPPVFMEHGEDVPF